MNCITSMSWVPHRSVAGLFAAIALTALAAGQAAAQRQLVMYCGVDEKWCRAVSNAYQKETGVQVDMTRMSAGEGLLVNGELPPVVFRQRRHYLDPDLRRLKGAADR